jgi:hypothetical protein
MKAIPFTAEMIRAYQRGQKTQTRRVMRKQPENANQCYGLPLWEMWGGEFMSHGEIIKCPYGQPGDLLAFLEGYQIISADTNTPQRSFKRASSPFAPRRAALCTAHSCATSRRY